MSSSAPTHPASAQEIRLALDINASPDRVWGALVQETASWWPASFHTSPRTRRFVIEPRLGGMMGEVAGRGEGLVWYRVVGVEKPTSLLLAGYLVPPWAGPATSLLRLTLAPAPGGGTRFELCDSTFGRLGDPAATSEGWNQIFAEHFTAYVTKARRRATRARR